MSEALGLYPIFNSDSNDRLIISADVVDVNYGSSYTFNIDQSIVYAFLFIQDLVDSWITFPSIIPIISGNLVTNNLYVSRHHIMSNSIATVGVITFTSNSFALSAYDTLHCTFFKFSKAA